jgi:hypothetical protein
VDISSDYIAEAKRNCEQRGIRNVEFSETLTPLLDAKRGLSLIHSCIVFNHIAWHRGQTIIGDMFQLLRPGGVMAIHVLHHQEIGRLHRLGRMARKFLPIHWLINLVRGRRIFEPLMQANEYPLDELVALLHGEGASGIYIQPHSNDHREHWAFVYCVKPGS